MGLFFFFLAPSNVETSVINGLGNFYEHVSSYDRRIEKRGSIFLRERNSSKSSVSDDGEILGTSCWGATKTSASPRARNGPTPPSVALTTAISLALSPTLPVP